MNEAQFRNAMSVVIAVHEIAHVVLSYENGNIDAAICKKDMRAAVREFTKAHENFFMHLNDE